MKYIYLFVTILCQSIIIHIFEDKYVAIIAILMFCAIVGMTTVFTETSKKVHDFGWGLLFGTLTATVIFGGLYLYVASLFRH